MKEKIITRTTCTLNEEPSSRLDINEYLVENKTTTYFIKVKGDSMEGAHIFNGDILVVDRSKTPSSRKIILASVEGKFLVRRLIFEGKKTYLQAENPKYRPLEIKEGMDFEVFGTVTYAIHKPL
jgi:DNA polymerase V